MKIEIETKYDVGDIVIGYKPKYGFVKYIIKDVIVERRSYDYNGGIEYLCENLIDGNLSCRETFAESELFTADDIYEQLGKVVTYPTTTEQAKHDLDMYVGIKDYIRNQPAVNMSDNVRWIDFINWLESKFPEMEQYVKMNTRIKF